MPRRRPNQIPNGVVNRRQARQNARARASKLAEERGRQLKETSSFPDSADLYAPAFSFVCLFLLLIVLIIIRRLFPWLI